MAPLQKRALISLLIGLALAIALIVVFVTGDINAYATDLGFRLIVYALWIGVPVVYLLLINLTRLSKLKQVDERDRLIKDRAPKIQWLSVIFTLVVWYIILNDLYWDQGQLPVVYLTLILISTLVISALAESLGILIGYWRMNRNG
jgi:peptidoglycan/LPS O-acetylase OafA/YrhL